MANSTTNFSYRKAYNKIFGRQAHSLISTNESIQTNNTDHQAHNQPYQPSDFLHHGNLIPSEVPHNAQNFSPNSYAGGAGRAPNAEAPISKSLRQAGFAPSHITSLPAHLHEIALAVIRNSTSQEVTKEVQALPTNDFDALYNSISLVRDERAQDIISSYENVDIEVVRAECDAADKHLVASLVSNRSANVSYVRAFLTSTQRINSMFGRDVVSSDLVEKIESIIAGTYHPDYSEWL